MTCCFVLLCCRSEDTVLSDDSAEPRQTGDGEETQLTLDGFLSTEGKKTPSNLLVVMTLPREKEREREREGERGRVREKAERIWQQ